MSRLYLILLFLFQAAFSQQSSNIIIGEEELAGVNVYSMLQDVDHSILLSTNEGVIRYNSLQFYHLNSQSVVDLSIFGLIKNQKNQIFCYNFSGQIFEVKSNKLVVYYQIPKSFLSNNIYLSFDSQGNLIVSCKKLLLIKNGKLVKEIYTYKSNYAEGISNDDEYNLYFTDCNIVYVWRNNKLILYKKIKNHYANTIRPFSLKNNKVNFSVSTEARCLIENRESFKEINYLEKQDGESFHPLISKNKEIIWFASSKNGVYAFKPSGEKLFGDQKLYKNYFISSHLEDFEGNIWLSTFGKGVIFIPNLNLVDFSNLDILKEEELLRITHNLNSIYFGGSNGTVYKLDKGKVEKLKEGFGRIEFLKYDPYSNIFFVNSWVLDSKFNEIAKHQYNKYDVIFEDKKYWFTTREGLFLLPNLQSQPIFQNYSYRSYSIVKEVDGRFWIASSSGLEMRESDKNPFKKILFQSKPIFSSHLRQVRDEVWVPSTTGLLIYKKGKLVNRFSTKNGLLSNSPIKLINDGEFVYISHHQGIQRFSLSSKKFVNFTKADGLIFNAIIDFDVCGDDVFLITAKGLQKVNFNYLKKATLIPEVKITKIALNGAQIQPDQNSFSHNENTLEFYISAISHQYRNKLKYNYILEGYENKWHTGYFSSDKILYQKLPPGDYHFKIRAAFDTVHGKISTFHFKINEVFWKSKIVIISGLFFLALIGYYGYNRRVNYLMQKQQQELEQERFKQELNRSKLSALKSQMNPHFVFNALNSIQDFILLNQKELASNYLGDFADLMRGYLDHSQEDKISLQEEIELLELYLKLEKVRFEDDFAYEILTSKDIDKMITIPSFLIQPYVENAIKHGLMHKKGMKSLKITFNPLDDKVLECNIEDNGIGRSESAKIRSIKKHKSFATEANKTRLELLNSNSKDKIGVQIIDLIDANKNNSGTLVKLTIPII